MDFILFLVQLVQYWSPRMKTYLMTQQVRWHRWDWVLSAQLFFCFFPCQDVQHQWITNISHARWKRDRMESIFRHTWIKSWSPSFACSKHFNFFCNYLLYNNNEWQIYHNAMLAIISTGEDTDQPHLRILSIWSLFKVLVLFKIDQNWSQNWQWPLHGRTLITDHWSLITQSNLCILSISTPTQSFQPTEPPVQASNYNVRGEILQNERKITQ